MVDSDKKALIDAARTMRDVCKKYIICGDCPLRSTDGLCVCNSVPGEAWPSNWDLSLLREKHL